MYCTGPNDTCFIFFLHYLFCNYFIKYYVHCKQITFVQTLIKHLKNFKHMAGSTGQFSYNGRLTK